MTKSRIRKADLVTPRVTQSRQSGGQLGHSSDQVGRGGGRLGHSSDQVEERRRQLGHSSDAGDRDRRDPRPSAATSLTRWQTAVVNACHEPQSLSELLARVGASHRTHFRRTQIGPLLDAGILRMTNPEKPRAANQRYVLTEAGAELRTQAPPRQGNEDR